MDTYRAPQPFTSSVRRELGPIYLAALKEQTSLLTTPKKSL